MTQQSYEADWKKIVEYIYDELKSRGFVSMLPPHERQGFLIRHGHYGIDGLAHSQREHVVIMLNDGPLTKQQITDVWNAVVDRWNSEIGITDAFQEGAPIYGGPPLSKSDGELLVWTTGYGHKIPVPELDADHLMNIIRMAERRGSHGREKVIEACKEEARKRGLLLDKIEQAHIELVWQDRAARQSCFKVDDIQYVVDHHPGASHEDVLRELSKQVEAGRAALEKAAPAAKESVATTTEAAAPVAPKHGIKIEDVFGPPKEAVPAEPGPPKGIPVDDIMDVIYEQLGRSRG